MFDPSSFLHLQFKYSFDLALCAGCWAYSKMRLRFLPCDSLQCLAWIIDSEAYKKDYQDITEKIVFDNINYSTAIKALQTVVDSKLF